MKCKSEVEDEVQWKIVRLIPGSVIDCGSAKLPQSSGSTSTTTTTSGYCYCYHHDTITTIPVPFELQFAFAGNCAVCGLRV